MGLIHKKRHVFNVFFKTSSSEPTVDCRQGFSAACWRRVCSSFKCVEAQRKRLPSFIRLYPLCMERY